MSNHYYVPQYQQPFVPAYVNRHERNHVTVSLGDDVYRGCHLINTNQIQPNHLHFSPAPSPSYRHQSRHQNSPSMGTIRSSVRYMSINEVLNQRYGSGRDQANLPYQLVDGVMVLPMIPPTSAVDIENMWLASEDFTDSGAPAGVDVPDETIEANLTLKIYTPSKAASSSDEEQEICVVCQDEYENMEKIGALRCGHEYHVECIKKWLRNKNVCPICKATPLPL